MNDDDKIPSDSMFNPPLDPFTPKKFSFMDTMKYQPVLQPSDPNVGIQFSTSKSPVGVKFDEGKARMDLLDPYAIEQLSLVLTYGAKKYAEHNWRKGISFGRLLAAAERHLMAFQDGEDIDNESGLPHVAHAMCCCMFLIWESKFRRDMDDRWTEKS